jgi:multidrug efflux pump subunit AcrA (membrane-fusion protein)
VYGQITVSVVQSAVVIPTAALVPGDESGTYKVFVVDAKGVAHATAVNVGDRTESLVEITDGLKGGETVVTQGAYGIADSATVTVPVAVKS